MHNMIDKAVTYLRAALPFTPEIGLILGSGIQPLADEIENAISIPYVEIPGMPHATAPGHIGEFSVVRWKAKPSSVCTVVCMVMRDMNRQILYFRYV